MKTTAVSILIAGLFIAGAIMYGGNKIPSNNDSTREIPSVNNVSVVLGKQIVEITAKGGYSPQISVAKAGIPTILRVDTNGTFDCSSSIRIPSLNIAQFLPQTGSTDIDLGSQKAGVFQGTCGMGMYHFEIDFK